LLKAQNETDKVFACATDHARHDRMLDISGGDGAALAEISEAYEVLLAVDEPNLEGYRKLSSASFRGSPSDC
jgi:hypothetical protein